LKNNKVFSNVCSELCGTVIYETLTAWKEKQEVLLSGWPWYVL
jgi:hypothetical protein